MIGWFVETLVASSILMLGVLMLRTIARHRFGARVAYWLWLLPLARMLTPALPSMAGPAHPIIETLPLWKASATDASSLQPMAQTTLATAGSAVNWTGAALVFWGVGVVLFLLWQLACYYRFLGGAQAGAREFTRAGGISVLLSTTVPGACSTGILRRRIFLPADFTHAFSREQVRLVLAHETAHHVRGDIWANAAAIMVVAIHWFNPLAHLAYRAFRTDQELACDETVLSHESERALHPYGLALVRAATSTPHSAACLLGSVDQVKTRLEQMNQPFASQSTRAVGMCGTLMVTAAGVILSASTYAAIPRVVAKPPPPPPAIARPDAMAPVEQRLRPTEPRTATRVAATARAPMMPSGSLSPPGDPGVDGILASGRETLRAACGIHTRIENIDAPGVDIGSSSGLAYRCQSPDVMRAVSRRLQDEGLERIATLNLDSAVAGQARARLEAGFSRIERDFAPDGSG
ncbi:MAG: hypothetical protein BVN33_07515 [Proteobacteria bacterium ST_bin13]|nr:MAG: hypothetical protein BVN33_07515 [Proteobacteria bacterium ST_bin13]